MNVYEYAFTRHKVAEVPGHVRMPRDIHEVVGPMIGHAEQEHFVVVMLNTKNGIIGTETVYVGNVSAALVRVAEVFRGAIRLNAAGIIVAHNHPSGALDPSPDDLHLTAEIIAAGRLLDIPLLDHVIVTDDGWVSLRDRGVAFDRR